MIIIAAWGEKVKRFFEKFQKICAARRFCGRHRGKTAVWRRSCPDQLEPEPEAAAAELLSALLSEPVLVPDTLSMEYSVF